MLNLASRALTLRHLANGEVKSILAIDGRGFLFDNLSKPHQKRRVTAVPTAEN